MKPNCSRCWHNMSRTESRPSVRAHQRALPRVVLAAMLLALLTTGCASAPPRSPDNLCRIFEERPRWYRSAVAAEREWGVPVPVAMAFVHRESSYIAKARPPRGRMLGVIPWRRPSSAYGYAQATNAAWSDYLSDTRRRLAGRTSFDDSIDFIGWYNHRSATQLGIAKDDPFNLYLAYYAGPTGYRRQVWRNDPRIRTYATKVADRAQHYRVQLASCEDGLRGGFWSRVFG